MPNEEIVKMIEEGIVTYRQDPTSENFDKLVMPCLLLTTKKAVGDKDPLEMGAELKRDKQLTDAFKQAQWTTTATYQPAH